MRRRRDDVAAAKHDPALIGLLEPCQQAQQCGLAAPRGAEESEELVAVNVEAQPVDCGDVAKAPRHIFEAHQRLGCRIRPGRKAASHPNPVRTISFSLMESIRKMIKEEFMPPPCPGTAGVSPAFPLPALRSKEGGRDARGPRVGRGRLRCWQSWALGAQQGHATFRRQTHYMSRERHTSCGRLVALECTVQRLLARRRTRWSSRRESGFPDRPDS